MIYIRYDVLLNSIEMNHLKEIERKERWDERRIKSRKKRNVKSEERKLKKEI